MKKYYRLRNKENAGFAFQRIDNKLPADSMSDEEMDDYLARYNEKDDEGDFVMDVIRKSDRQLRDEAKNK